MRKIIFLSFLFIIPSIFFAQSKVLYPNFTVIAHRGGSYAPEHTFETKAYSIAVGANYIEQDVAITKDNIPIVVHDIVLERITDVKDKFPQRKRADGHYYTSDFTFEEIKTLVLHEGILDSGAQEYPERYPADKGKFFRIHSLEEELEFVQEFKKRTHRDFGIYSEMKSPAFFRAEGHDVTLISLNLLKKYGYTKATDPVFIQCFDFNEIKRIKTELYPKLGISLKLIQLITYTDDNEVRLYKPDGTFENVSFDWMFQKGAMKELKKYVDGIGPWYPMLVKDKDTKFADDLPMSTKDNFVPTIMLKEAKENKLLMHPYTWRMEKNKMPDYVNGDYAAWVLGFAKLGVDGIFTDYPEETLRILGRLK